MIADARLARRKQGGSQSVNDNAKHKATSAGAMLRRYGEQALRDVCLFMLHIGYKYTEKAKL
jgi:hypothetical protein